MCVWWWWWQGVTGATVHWYGKEDVKKNRKVGHITVCAGSAVEALNRVAEIQGKPASKPAPQVSPSLSLSHTHTQDRKSVV